MKTKHLDFLRLSNLIKIEIITNYRTLLLGAGAITGVLLFLSLATVRSSFSWNFHDTFYPFVLFLVGYIFTSTAFKELHQYPRNYSYLTLPASILEKFLTKFLLTSVGFIIITLIGYFVFSILAAVLTNLVFGRSFPLFDPFNSDVWTVIKVYFITQSIFLFGSVYFKSHSLLKVLLSSFLFSIFISLLFLLTFKIVFHSYSMYELNFSVNRYEFYQMESLGRAIATVSKAIFHYMLAPYFWVLTFLRLKETEV